MQSKYANFPPLRSELKEKFGYLSFNCTLINLDLVGIRILKSYETVVILYRGAYKVGFIYEGDQLTKEHLDRVYSDVPVNWNHLAEYERKFEGLIEILGPPRDNYVFISDQEVIKKTK